MRMIPVKSSTISGVGYDAARLTLYIEFREGFIYAYYGVSAEVHEQFLKAVQPDYFARNIRDRYASLRVDDPDRLKTA
jgi:hypothetical protein